MATISSIRCGAGTVVYWTDWPGEWHSPVILKLTVEGVRHCLLTAGSWSQHLQPHRGGSTVGGGSPRYQTMSLFPFLQTCIAAGEPASSSVSSHSLNHLSSWVLAARSKPFHTVLPFGPKGMAKSQNGQACIVAWRTCTSSFSPAAPAEAMPKLFPTQSTHKKSVDTLEVATLHKHRTAQMGILESPLTSQPKEGTKGLSRGEWPVG